VCRDFRSWWSNVLADEFAADAIGILFGLEGQANCAGGLDGRQLAD